MKGISITSAPSLRRSAESALAWWRARPTRIRIPAKLCFGGTGGRTRPDFIARKDKQKGSLMQSVTKLAALNERCSGFPDIAFCVSGSRYERMRWLGHQRCSQASTRHVQHTFQVVDHRRQADLGLRSF